LTEIEKAIVIKIETHELEILIFEVQI